MKRTLTRDLLESARERFLTAGIEEADLNAEMILAALLRSDRLRLRLEKDREVNEPTILRFQAMVKRREKREPLQYILGMVDFMGLRFEVNPSVLIPRPETEILVEEALEFLRRSDMTNPAVLDIGTGTGNIALALARYKPGAEITAMDISREALLTAQSNARDLAIASVKFVEADMFAEFLPGDRFDLIVANPPYVSADDFDALQPEIRMFEPMIATTDGADGFKCVRRILEAAPGKLRPGGIAMVELGAGQSEQGIRIAEDSGFSRVTVRNDFAGIPRVLIAACFDGQPKDGP